MPAIVQACAIDYDCSGDATIMDIFVFLNAWLANDDIADYNSGGLSTTDILEFLNDWFVGC
jgi:hypothetical protein